MGINLNQTVFLTAIKHTLMPFPLSSLLHSSYAALHIDKMYHGLRLCYLKELYGPCEREVL